MKNKKLSWLLLLLCPLMVATSALAKKQKARINKDKYGYVMKINRSAIAVVDSNVVVSLQITAMQDIPTAQSVILAPEIVDPATPQLKVELPLIFLNSRNQQIYFERDLRSEYPDALALRKKNGKNLDVDYLRSVKYEPWMDNAVLKLRKLSCACNDFKERGLEDVASLATYEEEEPEIQLFPVYLLPPADNSVKVREEKGSAYLCFVVNKWDIKPDYMDNPVELQKIHNSVNLVKNDSNVSIQKMTIEGFASPEGTFKHNVMLSENRTDALKKYLIRTGMTKNIRVEATGRGENWTGLIKYLRDHKDVPQYEKLLSIATSGGEADAKERQMRQEASEGYNYLLKNVFPSLRCTNYTVIYTVRPFTIEESEVVFETRPINLNLNEIYRLADKYANNEERYNSIIRKAYNLYPNDSYINLTLAYLALKKKNADEAAEYLVKVNNCPEKTMNEGLLAYLRGDVERAIKLVEQARLGGVTQAEAQLEEFKKLKTEK